MNQYTFGKILTLKLFIIQGQSIYYIHTEGEAGWLDLGDFAYRCVWGEVRTHYVHKCVLHVITY